MSCWNRISATVPVVFACLWPQRAKGGSLIEAAALDSAITRTGYLTVTPEIRRSLLAALARPTPAKARLALFFPGCLALAAPLLLFHLKRCGWSRCRVTASSDGLRLDALR